MIRQTDNPVIVADRDTAMALRADLAAARYTVDRVDALWGTEAAGALHRGNRVAARRAIEGRACDGADRRLASLATLFLLGDAIDMPGAERVFARSTVPALVRHGLLRADGNTVRAAVDIRPYAFIDDTGAGNWWIVSDLGELTLGGPLGPDHVLGIGGASTTLSGLQLTEHASTVLDLGTGCGIQALHARRFADRVVATDISERALAIAQMTAWINDVDGIEFRLGSLFEPVAGERFDRIVSNPPFVITPRRVGVPLYEYRDGGMVGDALVRTVLQGLDGHLVPGGSAQLLANWEYRADEDGLDRVRAWFADSGLDVWVIERERLDPSRYAETWIRDGGTVPGTAAFDELTDAWLDDFASRGVTGVGFGYVIVRKPVRDAGRFRRFERVGDALATGTGGLSATVARTLAAADWLADHDDQGLAVARLRVAGDATEERHYWPGNEDPSVITLLQGGGFARRVDADTALAGFVGACDGELQVIAIVGALAEILGVDATVLADDLLPKIRQLVLDGFVEPVSAD